MGKLWEKSGTIERDANDNRARGALAYFFLGGTTTPLTVYQDAVESTAHEHPLQADGAGRWPAVFIPFVTSYDVKVTTSGGTQLYYYTEIPNPDPVQAAEDTVDATQLLQTGDWIFTPKTGSRTGFVRANGRTIGNATSGASERANADTSELYTFLWNNFADAILPVTGGRGGSAASDFAADKPIALFDCRGGRPIGVDDMGNTAAGFLGSWVPFNNGNATTGGSRCGETNHQLITAELPSHTHTFTGAAASAGAHTHTGTTDSGGSHQHTGTTELGGAHSHSFDVYTALSVGVATRAGAGDLTGTFFGTATTSTAPTHTHDFTTASAGSHTHTFTTGSAGAHTHTVSGTTDATGSATAHNNVSYGITGNWLVKL